MRLVNQFRPFIVGLPIVVSQALWAVPPTVAWDFLGRDTAEESAVSGGIVRGADGTEVVPHTAKWTDGQAVRQAYAQEAAASGGVEQTAHTGPSRGGTLFGGNGGSIFGGSSSVPFSATKSRAQASTQTSGRKLPTWRGQQLRMPTKLFVRGGDTARPPMPNASTPNTRGPATVNGRQGLPSTTAGAYRPTTLPAARMSADVAPANGARPQSVATAGRRVMVDSNVAANTRSVAPGQQSPREATRIANATAPASFNPQFAAPLQAAQSVSAQPAPTTIEPKTPADRLILQAHDLAAKAQREEDFTRIIETCRRARVSQPSAPLVDYANHLAAWSFNRRGQIRAEAGRIKEAMLDFDDAIRANPKTWRALHNRGVLQAQAGNFEQAFDDLNLTIQFNPKYAKAYSNRAALFVVAGDLPAAFDDYGAAIELDPNLAVAHRGRGRACHLLGRLDDALDHYDAAVQLAPKDAYAVSSRADLLTDLGRYTDAADSYNHAIRVDPRFAGAYRGSAWLLATCPDSAVRNPALAVERAQLAIELDGKEDAVGFDTLAAALASAGDFSAAMQTVRQAIQVAPDNERDVYLDRLKLYQRAKPYRIAPVRDVAQVSYEAGSM